MAGKVEGIEVLDVLTSMQPDPDQAESWPTEARAELLERVLATPVARRPRWLGAGIAAVVLTALALLLPGVLSPPRPIVAVPAPTPSAVFDCIDLDPNVYPSLYPWNSVEVLFDSYDGEIEETPLVKAQMVHAGDGYWVIAAEFDGWGTTAWLGWELENGGAADANFLHLTEIKSPQTWDGGEAPSGRDALAAALACIA